ncbi:hypothetical protein DFQ28_006836 [Apophysomyces sp. BC1034]|nr:hypothetical protein DFQ29_002880 [Apophysomyces sp. BC1021]KAG0187120.1 hypothetical protein DFQ28_006836 [Apophysomyces sp. BC1034]
MCTTPSPPLTTNVTNDEIVENLQEATRQVLQARVPDHNVRIELIPIEWHRHIHDEVDPIMNRITLKSIPTIRLIENDYLADVLYYFSKDRGQKIIDNVTRLLNTSYHNFLEKHPDFAGEVVMLGYSLGGVIMYDILAHQREPTPEDEPSYQKVDFDVPSLDFKPTYFFTLGSPLGAVLTFRNQSPVEYHLEHDIIFENLFHPFDPLAYRFEPLINEYYTDQPAVLIDRSVPLGPSFSFPSMPSFPGLNLFSFFSWRMVLQQAPSEEQLRDATAAAAKEAELSQQGPKNQQNRGMDGMSMADNNSGLMSSVNTFLQYFTKGRRPGDGSDEGDKAQNSQEEIGIITWDPLREQTRERLLALRDDLDKKDFLKNHALYQKQDQTLSPECAEERPQIRTRAKTDSVKETPAEGEYIFSPTPGSIFEGSLDDTHLVRPSTPQKLVSRRHHLVEVLGIDGVRMDSFERAQLNFGSGKKEAMEALKTLDQDDMCIIEREGAEEISSVEKDGDTEEEAPLAGTSSAEQAKGEGLGKELNKELQEPGPGITKPGESKAEVAQDSSRAQASSVKGEAAGNPTPQDEAKEEEEEEEEKKVKQRELEKLPGSRRIDYVLQPESFMSMIANEYLVGLRAHFSYWTNKDLLWHIVRRLENLEKEPESNPENLPSEASTVENDISAEAGNADTIQKKT